MSRDRDPQHDVIAKVEWEPSLDAAHIGVAVDDAVVTSSGRAGTCTEKQAAERAAKTVRELRAIAQEIELRLPSGKRTADDEFAQRAESLIDWITRASPTAKCRSKRSAAGSPSPARWSGGTTRTSARTTSKC